MVIFCRQTVRKEALLYGRDVLKKGLIKRIGSGESINIWEDSWIPTSLSMKPVVRLDNATVSKKNELMLVNTRSWNAALINCMFVKPDVDAILQIKLGNRLNEDITA